LTIFINTPERAKVCYGINLHEYVSWFRSISPARQHDTDVWGSEYRYWIFKVFAL